jgi:drug/metabolite transporter (DMT)-like permease
VSGGSLWRGRLALAAAVVIWSSPPIFQFWLARSFDPWTQNFYRYAAGFAVMTPFLFWLHRREARRPRWREWFACALAAVPNAVHQITQTIAVTLLLPGVYALFGRISVVLTALLAVMFFVDERWIARSMKFQVGTALGLLGVAWLVGAPGGANPISTAGVLIALCAAVAWASYGILIKRSAAKTGAAFGSWAIGLFTTALLFPPMLRFGDAGAVWRADAWTIFILLFSGVLSIGLGHWLYYIGIRQVGAAPAQSALLLCPLGTIVLSAGIFGETFRAEQLAAGAVLLTGAFLALSAKPPVPSPV